MGSPTDELRARLDELGVEWTYANGTVRFNDGRRWFRAWAYNDDLLCVSMGYLTPEQAIAATVGVGTCKLVIEKRPRHGPWIYHYSCGYDFWQQAGCPMPVLKHCPNCGKRIAKED